MPVSLGVPQGSTVQMSFVAKPMGKACHGADGRQRFAGGTFLILLRQVTPCSVAQSPPRLPPRDGRVPPAPAVRATSGWLMSLQSVRDDEWNGSTFADDDDRVITSRRNVLSCGGARPPEPVVPPASNPARGCPRLVGFSTRSCNSSADSEFGMSTHGDRSERRIVVIVVNFKVDSKHRLARILAKEFLDDLCGFCGTVVVKARSPDVRCEGHRARPVAVRTVP